MSTDIDKFREENETLRNQIIDLENRLKEFEKTPSSNISDKFLKNLNQFSKFVVSVYNITNKDITLYSKPLFELLGYSAEEESNEKLFNQNHKYKYIHPDDASLVRDTDKKSLLLNDETTLDIEYRAKHKNGNWVWLRRAASIFSRTADGKPEQILSVFEDVTNYKKASQELNEAKDQAENAAKMKSEFLATMSREIRTPMNGVIAITSLLMQSELNAEQREFLELIKQSGESLLNLINEILDFSKIESGKIVLDAQPFSLESCLKEVLDVFICQNTNKNIIYSSKLMKDVPLVIKGDVSRIKQVLINLLGNASKFTNSGEISVTVQKKKIKDNKIVLLFSVIDTGLGINKESIPNLFQPFTHISANVDKTKGSGLGLSICKKLVELMQGDICVESERGKGSTFFFTLELEICDDKMLKKETDLKSVELTILSDELPLNILLVEDNPINQKVAQRILKKFGYTIDTAVNGLLALENIKNKKYDIIFMDIQMPEMDGLEATKIILDKYKEKAPKIIAMTAAVMKGDKEKCLEVGMVDYIPKPVLPEVVYKAIKKWGKLTCQN